MRIQNNIMAMNTHRVYGINNANVQKSSEKLSSGFRINRAGDDAAGLAISEKMRAQVRGLTMASKNSSDAISLVQTAEGALQEVHSMLQRMSELAIQSNTGTNENFDRSALEAEFQQLKLEIDDIAEQTTFNNMKILKGKELPPDPAVTNSFSINTKFAAGESINIGGFDFIFGDGTNGTIGGANAAEQAANLALAINEAGIGDITATANGNQITLESPSGMTPPTPTVKGAMVDSTNITVTKQPAVGSISYQFNNNGGNNFKAGDTFSAANGTTYVFGQMSQAAMATFAVPPTEIALGATFDESMMNLTDALNASSPKMVVGTGTSTQSVAGSWGYAAATDKLTFTAFDPTLDFNVKAPATEPAVKTESGIIGGITTEDGPTPKLDIATFNIAADVLKSGSTFKIGTESFTIGNDVNFNDRLNALVNQINNGIPGGEPASDKVTAKNVDGKLELTTKAVGNLVGDVKVVTNATTATADYKLTTALVAGESVDIDGATYTAEQMGIGTGTTAASQMKTLALLINGNAVNNPNSTLKATFNSTAGKIELETRVAGNVTIVDPGPVSATGINRANIEKVADKTQSGGNVKASAALTFTGITGNFLAGETIDFNGGTITFGGGLGEVAIGADFNATMCNIAAHLNLNSATIGKVVDGASAAITGSWAFAAGALKFTAASATQGEQINSTALEFSNYTSASIVTTAVPPLMDAAPPNNVKMNFDDGAIFASTKASAKITFGIDFADGDTFDFEAVTGTPITVTLGASGDVPVGTDNFETLVDLASYLNTVPGGSGKLQDVSGTWTALSNGTTSWLEWQSSAMGSGEIADVSNIAITGTGTIGSKAGVNGADGVATKATATLDLTAAISSGKNFTAGETIDIDGVTFTFGTGLGEVAVGADARATYQNLANALNTRGLYDGESGNWALINNGTTTTLEFTAATAGFTGSVTDVGFENYIGVTPGPVGIDGNLAVTPATVDGGAIPTKVKVDLSQLQTDGVNFKANDTIDIGSTTYTFVASGATGNQINIGTDIAATITNIQNKLPNPFNGTVGGNWANVAGELTFTSLSPVDIADVSGASISNFTSQSGTIGQATFGNAKAGSAEVVSPVNRENPPEEPETMAAFSGRAVGAAVGTGTLVDSSYVIQVGATKGELLEIKIGAMSAKGLGIADLSVAEQGEEVGKAGDAIKVVKEAINRVSEQRASLGAMQNRLEHKIANLDVSAENLQAAESRIRDVDMAKEMTNFTKNNILSQAATAMLAQANAAPQGVLQLLR